MEAPCTYCKELIPCFSIGAHNWSCLYDTYEKAGLPIPCTCSSCKGRIPHPASNPLLPSIPQGVQSLPTPPVGSHIEYTKKFDPLNPDAYFPSPNHLLGKTCIICDRTTKDSGSTYFPIINVGKFMKIRICLQSHIVNESALKDLVLVLKHLVDRIQAEGDKPFGDKTTFMNMLSDDEEMPSDSNDVEDNTCVGVGKSMEKCEKIGKWILSFPGKNRFFCSPRHLICYFLNYKCLGRKGDDKDLKELKRKSEAPASKKAKSPRKKPQKLVETSDDEEEAEEEEEEVPKKKVTRKSNKKKA